MKKIRLFLVAWFLFLVVTVQAAPVVLGQFTTAETFDVVTSEDGYVVFLVFRSIVGDSCLLFIVAAPESNYGGYALIEAKTVTINRKPVRSAVFRFQNIRYVIKDLGEQVVEITKEVIQ